MRVASFLRDVHRRRRRTERSSSSRRRFTGLPLDRIDEEIEA
jgi:hypothetical protein